VGEKKKEELKGATCSLTQHMWFASYEKGQFCSCSSPLGMHPACSSYQKGERVALCKQVSAGEVHYHVSAV